MSVGVPEYFLKDFPKNYSRKTTRTPPGPGGVLVDSTTWNPGFPGNLSKISSGNSSGVPDETVVISSLKIPH